MLLQLHLHQRRNGGVETNLDRLVLAIVNVMPGCIHGCQQLLNSLLTRHRRQGWCGNSACAGLCINALVVQPLAHLHGVRSCSAAAWLSNDAIAAYKHFHDGTWSWHWLITLGNALSSCHRMLYCLFVKGSALQFGIQRIAGNSTGL